MRCTNMLVCLNLIVLYFPFFVSILVCVSLGAPNAHARSPQISLIVSLVNTDYVEFHWVLICG